MFITKLSNKTPIVVLLDYLFALILKMLIVYSMILSKTLKLSFMYQLQHELAVLNSDLLIFCSDLDSLILIFIIHIYL